MALFGVLRRQTNRGHARTIADSDGADLTSVGRTTSGSATLYTDSNTTDITIGGGAALSALVDLRGTNPTLIRSTSNQNLQLLANGASADLSLSARSSAYLLNDVSNTTLNTTNQTLIGALNELNAALGGPGLLATVTGIDATVVAETTLYTATGTTVITGVILLCTAASGITTEATAGVGIAVGEDDIFSSEPLTGLTVVNKAFNYLFSGTRVVAVNTDAIKLGIDTAAIGTSQVLTAYILGFTV